MDSAYTNSPEFSAQYVGRKVVDVAILMGTLEVILMGLFAVTRVRNRAIYGMDTYLMVPAFMFSFSLEGDGTQHLYVVSPTNL
jgi:hypothetical protein